MFSMFITVAKSNVVVEICVEFEIFIRQFGFPFL